MAPSWIIDLQNWNRTFRTKLYPHQDKMKIGMTFYGCWNENLNSGQSYLTDPKGNVMFAQIAKQSYYAFFSSGAQNIKQFYNLNSLHYVALHYVGDNKFDMKIFTVNGIEVDYPLLHNGEGFTKPTPIHCFRKFCTRLYPYWDYMKISLTFFYFANHRLVNGDSYLEDPNGHVICLELTMNPDDPRFSSGVSNMAAYYSLQHEICDVELDYDGHNKFKMRIYSLNGKEIAYPDVLSQSLIHSKPDGSQTKGSWIKVLTKADASAKNPLAFPAHFVRDVLNPTQTLIYLTDEKGNSYECKIRRTNRSQTECYIVAGWTKYLKNNNLRNGQRLKFWIAEDPMYLFVKVINV